MTDGAEVTGAGDARRFEALASAIVGRPMRVAWTDGGPACTDGRTIELSPAFADRARDAVIVQAALLAGGALDPDRVRALRGRPRRIEAHLRAEVPACLAALAEVLPPLRWPVLPGVVEPWWGTIRPERLRRAARTPDPASATVDLVDAPDAALDGAVEDPGSADDRRRAPWRSMGDPSNRRRRRKGSRAGGDRSVAGDATQGRAALGTAIGPALRLAQHDAGPILAVDPPGRAGATAVYPEWDIGRGGYRAGWCEVHDLVATPGPSSGEDRSPEGNATRRRLAGVHLDLVSLRRQPQGDDLDLDAVVEHRVQLAAGTVAPGHVYRDARRLRRDLGVLVLVDGSGSTGRARADAPTVTEAQIHAAATLVDAFEALGDRVACHVFRSHGRRRVELTAVKSFDGRFDAGARALLAAVRPEGFTRLGAAVRHGARLLVEGSGSRRWLLVVLSDGFPFDAGYEGAYAAADVGHALSEARRAGVGSLCLSVGATTPDAELRAVFGSSTYAAGPHLDDLGADLASLVRAALAGADQSRRLPHPA